MCSYSEGHKASKREEGKHKTSIPVLCTTELLQCAKEVVSEDCFLFFPQLCAYCFVYFCFQSQHLMWSSSCQRSRRWPEQVASVLKCVWFVKWFFVPIGQFHKRVLLAVSCSVPPLKYYAENIEPDKWPQVNIPDCVSSKSCIPDVQMWQEECGAQAIPLTQALWLFSLATGVQGTRTSKITTWRYEEKNVEFIGSIWMSLTEVSRLQLHSMYSQKEQHWPPCCPSPWWLGSLGPACSSRAGAVGGAGGPHRW